MHRYQEFEVEYMDPAVMCPSSWVEDINDLTIDSHVFGASPTMKSYNEPTDEVGRTLAKQFYFCGERTYVFAEQGTGNPITWLTH